MVGRGTSNNASRQDISKRALNMSERGLALVQWCERHIGVKVVMCDSGNRVGIVQL